MVLISLLSEKTNLQNTIFKTAFGVILMAIMSQIFIPLNPIPITLQTVGVLFIGLTFDRKSAIAAITAYVMLGILGVPVFPSFGTAVARFYNFTAGYYAGMIVAVALLSTLRTRFQKPSFLQEAFLSILGTAIISVCGVLFLTRIMPLNNAISVGLIPFIVPGLMKSCLLAGILNYIRR